MVRTGLGERLEVWKGRGSGQGPEGLELEQSEWWGWKGQAGRSPRQPVGSNAVLAAVPPCGPLVFPCGTGACSSGCPCGWCCDQEDSAEGSNEQGCRGPCAVYRMPCARVPHCVTPAQLCEGVPRCLDGLDKGPDACGEHQAHPQSPPCAISSPFPHP